jgi:hypothetical protein
MISLTRKRLLGVSRASLPPSPRKAGYIPSPRHALLEPFRSERNRGAT